MPQSVIQVDAFAERPFTGNSAAVCLMDSPRDEVWMQDVAMEMNLSETAFLHPHDGGYSLRWFTPAVEVALCGHATLASAHVLWETGALAADAEARFHTQSGLLTCRREGEWIWMDFPAKPDQPAGDIPGLAAALGAEPVYVGRSQARDLARGLRGLGGEVHPDPVAVAAAGEEAALRVEARLRVRRKRARLPQHVRAGQRGVAAERDLHRGREPAQRVAAVVRVQERGLGEVHLHRHVLHPHLVARTLHHAHGRGVPHERPLGERIYLNYGLGHRLIGGK